MKILPFAEIAFFFAFINVSKRFPLAVTCLFKFLLCFFFVVVAVAYTKTALIIFVTVFLYNFS